MNLVVEDKKRIIIESFDNYNRFPKANYKIIVFTPTYNRACTLPRLFESLQAQTCLDFFWLLIDDGSTDNTSSLLREMLESSKFPIRYVYKENGGKHSAHNLTLDLVQTEYISGIDSDDAYYPHAIKTFLDLWESIPPIYRERYMAVVGISLVNGEFREGKALPESPFDATHMDAFLRYGITGDMCDCSRTTVLKKFRVPENLELSSWYPENIIWFQISKAGYINRYVKIPVLLCFRDFGDSITLKNQGSNPAGAKSNYYLWAYYVNEATRYVIYSPVAILKGYIGLSMCGFATKRKFMREPNRFWKKILVAIFSPIGRALCKIKYGI